MDEKGADIPGAYRIMKSEGTTLRPVVGDSATKSGSPAEKFTTRRGGQCIAWEGRHVCVAVDCRVATPTRGKAVESGRMVPRRLYDLGVVPAAAGENTLHIFRIGDGVFERGPIALCLTLLPDPDIDGKTGDHGTIEPATTMRYDEYRQAIIKPAING